MHSIVSTRPSPNMTSRSSSVPVAVSRRLAAVRHKDSEPELILRRARWARGRRFRLYSSGVIGKPELVLSGSWAAVFVDGDFWHDRLVQEGRMDALAKQFRRRRGWWLEMVQGYITSDARVGGALESLGRTVVRVWESEIREDVRGAVQRFEVVLGGWAR